MAMEKIQETLSGPAQVQNGMTLAFKNDQDEISKTRDLTTEQAEMLNVISIVINDIPIELKQTAITVPIYSFESTSFDYFLPFIKSVYQLKIAHGNKKRLIRKINEMIDELSLVEKLNVLKVADYLIIPLFKDILVKNIAKSAQTLEQLEIFKNNYPLWRAQYTDIIDHLYLIESIVQTIMQSHYFSLLNRLQVPHTTIGADSEIFSVAWSPDDTKLVSGTNNGVIYIWDAITGNLLNTLRGHTNTVRSVAWNSDGTKIASGSKDGTIRIWDSMGNPIKTIVSGAREIYSVAWNFDNTRLASGSTDALQIWDGITGELLNTLSDHRQAVLSVAWSLDGSRIASGSKSSAIHIWHDDNLRHILKGHGVLVKGHGDWVNSVAWSPNSINIASGSDDNTVCIWNAMTGKQLNTLIGHTAEVLSVKWSPDGSKLASGSWDTTIRVWDSSTGKLLKILGGDIGLVNSVDWGHDGTKIASGVLDKTIRIWDMSPLINIINILNELDLPQALFITYVLSGKKWSDNNHMIALFETLPNSIKKIIKRPSFLTWILVKNYFKKRLVSK